MNANMFKGVLTMASVLLVVGSASSALAQSRDGMSIQTLTPAQTLGASASATDVWVATCPLGKTGLSADVFDRAGINNAAAQLRVTIVKDNAAIGATDVAEGGGASGSVTLSKGAGAYTIVFGKSAANADDYDSFVFCQPNNTNPTSLLLIQNQ